MCLLTVDEDGKWINEKGLRELGREDTVEPYLSPIPYLYGVVSQSYTGVLCMLMLL